MMIHATFEDGTTMLFFPDEIVHICKEVVGGEYISGDECGRAILMIKPGVYVLDKVNSNGAIPSETRISKVRQIP